jgi:hypothetical protein
MAWPCIEGTHRPVTDGDDQGPHEEGMATLWRT